MFKEGFGLRQYLEGRISFFFLATLALNMFEMLFIILINKPKCRFSVSPGFSTSVNCCGGFRIKLLSHAKLSGPSDRRRNFCLSWAPQWVKGAVLQCCGHVASKTKLHSKSLSRRDHPWKKPPADPSGQPAGSRWSGIRGIKERTRCECLKMWIHAFLSFSDLFCVCLFCFFYERAQCSVVVACSADDADMS